MFSASQHAQLYWALRNGSKSRFIQIENLSEILSYPPLELTERRAARELVFGAALPSPGPS